MQALLAPLKELAEYDEIRKAVRQGKGTVALSGCVDSQKLHMIYGLSDGVKYKVIVTYNDLKAKEIYEEYRFYADKPSHIPWPPAGMPVYSHPDCRHARCG